MDRRQFLMASCAALVVHTQTTKAGEDTGNIGLSTTRPAEKLTVCVVGFGALGGRTLLELGPLAARPEHTSISQINGIELRHLCIDANGRGLAYQPGGGLTLVNLPIDNSEDGDDLPGGKNASALRSLLSVDMVFVAADFDTALARRIAPAIKRLARQSGALTIALGAQILAGQNPAIDTGASLLLQSPHGDRLAEHIRMIVTCVATPGLIGIDLNDVGYALNCGDALTATSVLNQIAFGIADGSERAEKAAAMAIHALGSQNIRPPDGALVKIPHGGNSLRMAEIFQVLHTVRRHLPEDIFLIAASPRESNLAGMLTVEILPSYRVA